MGKFIEKLTDIFEDVWFYISEPWKDWVWPAFKIRRLLDRHDIIKLPMLSATGYYEVDTRAFMANMELLKYFIEKENPLDIVDWSDVTVGDDDKTVTDAFGLTGRNVMEVAQEIYEWYTVKRKQDEKECDYLLDVWYDYFSGTTTFVPTEKTLDGEPLYEYVVDYSGLPKELKELKDVDWGILDKYTDGDRKNILQKDFLRKKHSELEAKIRRDGELNCCRFILISKYLWV